MKGTPRHRRSIRLRGYDYTQAGTYFVTICTHDRACLFGEIVDGEMRLNSFGAIVREEWLRTATMRANVELDAYIVMPNHLHGNVVLYDGDGRGTLQRAPYGCLNGGTIWQTDIEFHPNHRAVVQICNHQTHQ